jgi:hypothetical protein
LEGIPSIKEPVVVGKGFLEPLRRSMREREKEGQRHQDIDGKLVALGYWEIKSR